VPEVATARDPKRVAKRSAPAEPEASPKPANDDRKARIATARPRRGRFGDVVDLTPKEHWQRCDAADALWRELVRRVTGEP
jgi:hypothetical protein